MPRCLCFAVFIEILTESITADNFQHIFRYSHLMLGLNVSPWEVAKVVLHVIPDYGTGGFASHDILKVSATLDLSECSDGVLISGPPKVKHSL